MSAQVAVVGSGLAGFTAYQTLRRELEPGEIAVFGTDADPAAAWRVRAAAIRQRQMRSESDGHCLATTFPGLAFGSVLRGRSLRPLLESVLDRYHPTVEEFLSHVERLRERSRWDESLVLRRVERVRAVDGGFDLEGDRFRHVLLAPGHPGLNVPEELRDDPRVVHSYAPHEYASTVTVVGAGLAAATEWLNALDAGAEVVSVRRREPVRRPLVEEHGLETAGHRLVLASDSTVPGLTDATRTLAVAGAPAQWAFPAADTLAGARYAAHGFLRRIETCRTR